jgi:hypothetical protein
MDRNNQFLDPIIRENKVLSNQYSPGVKYPDGIYFWKVGCIDSFGFSSEWSDPGSFEIRKPGRKEGPDPLYPPDRTVLENNDSLYFPWNPVSEADFYRFWLSTDSNFTYITTVEKELPENQYHSVPRLSNGIYFWKVTARLPDGEYSQWSPVFRFSMNEQPLPAPELIAPADSANITSTEIFFDWSDVENSDHYELMIDQNREFNNPVIYQKDISESNYSCTFLFEPGAYYWLVRAVDQKGEEGLWSSFRTFNYESLEKGISSPFFPSSGEIP